MILSILRVCKFLLQKTEVLMSWTKECNATKMQEGLAFGIINAFKKIHLFLKRSRLVHNKTHNACCLYIHQQHFHPCCTLAA